MSRRVHTDGHAEISKECWAVRAQSGEERQEARVVGGVASE